MDVAVEIGQKWLYAAAQLLLHPFYYIGILFIVLQYRRQISFERKLFSVRLHSLLTETWRAVLWGFCGGVAASLLMAVIGVSLQPEAVMLIWVVSLLLACFRVRYLCFAYSVGLIGIAQAILVWIPGVQLYASGWGARFVQLLLGIDMPPLLALVAILHLAEGILIRLQGARMASPMFYESKRGKIVGGYQLQAFWPVALFLFIPLEGASQLQLPWQPLLGGDIWHLGWTMVGFPVMLGFTERTTTRLPQEKTRWSSTLLVLYAALVLLMAVAVHYWSLTLIIAAVLSIALHEGMMWLSQADEAGRSPYFAHTRKGLMILAVLPGSAAEQLGLKPGEMLHKVNGFPLSGKQDLHFAMRQNSAFCKLEVINHEGQSKFVQRALYSGEHHQLGIVLAPDQDALYYAEERQMSIFSYMRKKLTGLVKKQPPSHSA
ncbi:PDZ domain-containing protein [Paenibacillus thalictri]|uniref:PDZ domain-containing protein n=1 Tax=Paenibacillus thalictri TaxID=2527873 RepID=A0A4Q9DMM1_9BACL|nr:PDZ domain-containing protein [Paenibacillus thalictri]TBL73036.1 PDZ domain-containing protein [Paenibacillus thalictri]